MPDYKEPGVYVAETSPQTPAITEPATAIPAFVGYTDRTLNEGRSLIGQPVRIDSLAEFERIFGGRACKAFDRHIAVELDASNAVDTLTVEPRYYLYDSVRLFYANGGGACYVVSVGSYRKGGGIAADELERGIASLEQQGEPTILVVPDAVLADDDLLTAAIQASALSQCGKLRDRTAILDIRDGWCEPNAGGPIERFRNALTADNLEFGAAYYPWVDSTLPPVFDFGNIAIRKRGRDGTTAQATDLAAIAGGHTELLDRLSAALRDVAALIDRHDVLRQQIHAVSAARGPQDEREQTLIDGLTTTEAKLADAVAEQASLEQLMEDRIPVCKRIKDAVRHHGLRLPPGGAIAGVYCRVDNARGVWKAPANVDIAAVARPAVDLNDADQEALNTDAVGGKSVNAIRCFPGRGTLVWGARTLAGNDTEWRYISVRRFFNMLRESIVNGTAWAVFEPNDANTWARVEAVIRSYLLQNWRQGALLGNRPGDAFFVDIGLGRGMTQADILEGRMNVTIGLAVVRPAEFIILRFSHKLAACAP